MVLITILKSLQMEYYGYNEYTKKKSGTIKIENMNAPAIKNMSKKIKVYGKK
jgi:hypothetical protein